MSAIGGACLLNPVSSPHLAEILKDSLARTGPDGVRVLSFGSAFVGYGGFRISNEDSRTDCQPIRWGEDVVLVWDGRIDNKPDLLARLSDSVKKVGMNRICDCDAHLAMYAFIKWGERFPDHIIGDFAVSVYDMKQSTIHLARDPFGIRPLYFLRNSKGTWWCSDISFLLKIDSSTFQLDENFVAGYLTTTEDPRCTPYRGITAVPPGYVVTIKPQVTRMTRFWSPEPKQVIRYRADTEYEEHFRSLFTESLQCRMRAKGTVTAELSGGLDSSSIVCVAHSLIRRGLTEATALETVSFVYDEARTSDETSFMAEVIKETKLSNHRIVDQQIMSRAASNDNFIPNPHRLYRDTYLGLDRCMKSSGSRVLLSGLCGDHVFMHDQSYYPVLAELLAQRQLLSMHKVAMWVCQQRKRSYWQILWLGAIWPWLPLPWRVALSPEKLQLPEWIEPQFAKRTGFRERNLIREPGLSFKNPCLQQRVSFICNAVSASSAQRYREHLCVEVSMPYLHLPLVQFLLDVPSSQLIRPGEDRSLQRRSMVGILPEPIRTRVGKRSPDESFLRAVRRQWPHLIEECRDPIMARLGIISRPRFLHALEKARMGHAKYLGALFRTLSFELWLRSNEVNKKIAT